MSGELGPRRPFVRAVEEAVEQADRDGLDTLGGEDPGGRLHVFRHQRRQFPTIGPNPPAHRQAQVARHQNLGERRAVVPLGLADAAADLERIAEALGRQHPDPGPLLF